MVSYQKEYREHYLKINNVFPSSISLKLFLGKNPNFSMQGVDFKGKNILDVGYGDGRDLILFSELGLNIYGVEVDEQVVIHTRNKFKKAGIQSNLKVGTNDNTGYNENYFDYIYSNAALMYLKDKTTTIDKIISHIYAILKPEGYLLGSFTRADSHITKDAEYLSENIIRLKDPYYKLRDGQLYYIHKSKAEVTRDLTRNGFKNINVSDYDVDWFGTRETLFLFTAKK